MGASGGVFAFPPGVWLGFQGLCARCPVAKWALSAAPGLASTTYQAAALAWRIDPAATLFLFLGPLCQELCEASRSCCHECQHLLFSWASSAKSFARLPGGVTKSTSKAQMAVARTILRFARFPNGH